MLRSVQCEKCFQMQTLRKFDPGIPEIISSTDEEAEVKRLASSVRKFVAGVGSPVCSVLPWLIEEDTGAGFQELVFWWGGFGTTGEVVTEGQI